MKDVNLETIIDTLSWYKIWQLDGAKQKLLRKRKRVYESFSSRQTSRKSFTLTIHWNLAKPAKIIPGLIVRQHRTDRKRMGLLGERYAGLKKGLLLHCCNQVWMDNGGRIPWSVTVNCGTYKISCLMGKHFTKGDSDFHLTDQLFRLVRW